MIANILIACMLSGTPSLQASDNKPPQEQTTEPKDTTAKKPIRKLLELIGGKIKVN